MHLIGQRHPVLFLVFLVLLCRCNEYTTKSLWSVRHRGRDLLILDLGTDVSFKLQGLTLSENSNNSYCMASLGDPRGT